MSENIGPGCPVCGDSGVDGEYGRACLNTDCRVQFFTRLRGGGDE